MRTSFKTSKGTELPILNLRGKEYLEVKYRVVWFTEDKHEWSIETEAIVVTDTSAYFKATIRDEAGRVRATAHKFENKQGFPDFIEKAETGSIGRALALIGFGTQFCGDELDEGSRIVDSPVEKPKPQPIKMIDPTVEPEPADPGDYVIPIGKKFKGQKLKDIGVHELSNFKEWLDSNLNTLSGPLKKSAPQVIASIEKFLVTRDVAMQRVP